MLKQAIAVLAFTCSTAVIAPAHAAAPALPPATAASAMTFTMPPGWTRQQPTPALTILEAPEADLRLALVEVGEAADAQAAAAAAWRLYRTAGARPVKLLTARPAREGWDEAAVVDYETSPNEHVTVQSVARRRGNSWTIAIIDGSRATAQKRLAAVNLVLQSMRPAGYQRESFAGRTAHRLDPARVAQMIDFVRTSAEALRVPGVGFALIDHGKIVYEGGVGVRQIGKPDKVDAHTKFKIASNTKSMTTLLLAKLVDEGKLRWDQPVTEVYPTFRLGSNETTSKVLVRHLVCACTGLPRKDYERIFNFTRSTPASATFDLLAQTKPTSGFGEVFQYNNQMAAAAGYIAAHKFHPELELGLGFDRAMQEEIFDPLEMRDSTLSMARGLSGNHASPHSLDARGNVSLTSSDLHSALSSAGRPSGGAWSSPHDMILYVQNELNGGRLANGRQLVSAANLLARRQRGVPIAEDQWYGMGLREDATYGVSVIHHGGDLPGYHSDMYAIPSAQVGAIILTNADSGPAMRRPFMRRLLEILYDGRPEAVADVAVNAKQFEAEDLEWRSKLINPPPPDYVADLASAYANQSLGRLTIRRESATVRFVTTGWSSEVALRRNDDGTVSFAGIAPGVRFVNFVVGRDAASGKRTLTTRDGQHVYVFTEVD